MGKKKQSRPRSGSHTSPTIELSSPRLRRKTQTSTSGPSITRRTSQITPDNTTRRLRSNLLRHFRSQRQSCQARFHQNLTELTFLQGGAFLINYFDWRRKNRPALSGVLRSGYLDDEDLADINRFVSGQATQAEIDRFFPAVSGLTDNIVLTDFDSGLNKEFGLRLPSKQPKKSGPVVLCSDSDDDLDDGTALVEEINQKALEEALVLRRVADLKQSGLWTETAPSKTHEPVDKNKYYSDNLFAEIQWLSDDFVRERQWKKTAAKRLSQAAVKCVKDQEEKNKRSAKEEVLRLRKLAASVSKMVRDWWRQMDKIVQAKHQVRLVAKRQQAMNTHLGKVIETTEKYTEWLTEGLNAAAAQQDLAQDDDPEEGDVDFLPSNDVDTEDDEETIAREEEENGPSVDDVEAELAALKAEGEAPLEEILANLPFGDGEGVASNDSLVEEDTEEDKKSSEVLNDVEFEADEDSEDDETTLVEQERHEDPSVTAKQEVDMLESEANMSIDELMLKYQKLSEEAEAENGSTETPMEGVDTKKEDDDEESESDSGDESDTTEGSSSSEESEKESSEEDDVSDLDPCDVSLKDLFAIPEKKVPQVSDSSLIVEPEKVEPKSFAGEEEFNAISKEAMSLQPRGFTLDSAQIMVKVPYLIKHTLREYQQVGLDWLATIYEKRLNGILADEMGLGKTIQTIALLAHIACEKSVWGPHLIVVPTSVMLNWEMEFKKWCPGFKILTYYGSLKERKEKRKGWTKTNAFHVCITSYKLAVQDQNVFKRKKWKYFILDEAQNIKNFKSQRWQTLLTFNSQRRLLLTGTPLQNTLMELWSLMHFLMPNIFQSHREFQEWFASPLTGMIEGNNEYNEQLVKRLHKVLRPFILRRLKKDVEKQMPKKYEHVVICRLSRRQRFLYDDFMSLTTTSSALNSGHFLSVINILMQLRKVCNHPDILEPRGIHSSFQMSPLCMAIPCQLLLNTAPVISQLMTWSAQSENLADMARDLPGFVSSRIIGLKPRSDLIQHIDSLEPSKDIVQKNSCSTDFNRVFLPRGVVSELHDEYCKDIALNQLPNTEFLPKSKVPFIYPKMPTFPPFERKFRKITTPDELRQSGLPPEIISFRCQSRLSRLSLMANLNDLRCSVEPVYPSNLVHCLRRFFLQLSPSALPFETGLSYVSPRKSASNQNMLMLPSATPIPNTTSFTAQDSFCRNGYANCWRAQTAKSVGSVGGWEASVKWGLPCRPLCRMIASPEDRVQQLKHVIDRFVFVVPPAMSSKIQLDVSSANFYQKQTLQDTQISSQISQQSTQLLHKISSQQMVQFPDARLIQYDCGKLQTLEVLLRDLKSGHHRVLIFTQMTRMLDILERFLSYHGHRYLRLDGATKVEQRQLLMERFNQDIKIFVFILSTRSGGLGVNLTGADTVIFYDSDWNPTMDAQAQDRCHRIGQTRDVHIYRLISEKTIEENILKKANQKRFLSDIAIEGGQFTTAYFKQNTIKDLFEEPSGLEDLAREKNAAAASDVDLDTICATDTKTAEDPVKAKKVEEESGSQSEQTDVNVSGDVSAGRRRRAHNRASRRGKGKEAGGDMSETALEAALEEFEDENDRTAASKAKAEAKADLAEFDESIPWDEGAEQRARESAAAGAESEREDRAERELLDFHNQLCPIERFGVNCLESIWAPALSGQLELADAQLVQSKATWELDQLVALREAEELRAEVEDDDMLYCAPGSYDLTKQRRELDRIKRDEAREAKRLEQEAQEAKEARLRRMAEQQKRRQQLAANISAAQKRVKCAVRRPQQAVKPTKRKVAPLARFELPTNTIPDESPSPRSSGTPLDLSSSPNLSPCKQPRLDTRPPTPNRVPISRLPPSYYPSQRPLVRTNNSISHMQPRVPVQYRPLPQQQPTTTSFQYRPPVPAPPRCVEPRIPVVTGNGVRSVAPASQLLLNGQPVLVITRQSKTPTGEIVEQRFTQPIPANNQYLQVVQRIRSNIVVQQQQQSTFISQPTQPRILQMPMPTNNTIYSRPVSQHQVIQQHQQTRLRGPRPLRPALARLPPRLPNSGQVLRPQSALVQQQPQQLQPRQPTAFILQPQTLALHTASSIQPQCFLTSVNNGGQSSPLTTHVVKLVHSNSASQAPLG